MKRSTDRILTSHVGSLPRPNELAQMVFAQEDGQSVDTAALDSMVRQSVSEAVRKQTEAGIDVISDGEQSRVGMQYMKDRATGFGGESKPFVAQDLVEYPELGANLGEMEGIRHMRTPACVGPIAYNPQSVHKDVANFRDALANTSPAGAFITATSPGTLVQLIENRHYPSREAFMYAVADAFKQEYEAIVAAGFLLQVDACDLPMERHVDYRNASLDEFQAAMQLNVDAINHAVSDIPEDKIRLHICWGNYPGTHHRDVPLKDIIQLVMRVKCGAISFEAANPRHEHEWRVWEDVRLSGDKVLMPGVIECRTNYLEHPELVADRIIRYARIAGRENVIAGTDCGFGTFVGMSGVAPRVAQAKLQVLAEGARLASQTLF